MAGVLGTHAIVRCLLKAGRQREARPVNQVMQVTVVGTIVKNGIPSLRSGVTLATVCVCVCVCVYV